MAAIWQSVLQVDHVDRDNDFFDLGGHSLLVARLLQRIEADSGTRLPMAALFRAPRLADMAALVAHGRPAESAIVVPIQPRGSQPPLLWLEGGPTFRPLAERLGRDQPFLGISVHAILAAAGGCPERFEDIAALVATAIRDIQPRGPVRIGGWCTAGILAYAVAANLRETGMDVPLLVLAHAAHPPKFREIGSSHMFVSKLRFHLVESIARPKGERWQYFRERVKGVSDAAVGGAQHDKAILSAQIDEAARRYDPPRYGGDVVLFQPAEHPDVLDFIDDWAAGVTGNFTAHVIPGGHRTMLEAPQVDTLAGLLQRSLTGDNGPMKRQATG